MSDDPRYSMRSELLAEAGKIIVHDRNKSYGEPDEDFQRIAAIASAMGFRAINSDAEGTPYRELTGSDVARFMIALKLSRLSWMPTHRDSWLDIAGYAGCGYETAALEEERRQPKQKQEEAKFGVISSWLISDGMKNAARKAIGGDPSELERMGFILMDNEGDCWAVCEPEKPDSLRTHTFGGGCQYRIHQRRKS